MEKTAKILLGGSLRKMRVKPREKQLDKGNLNKKGEINLGNCYRVSGGRRGLKCEKEKEDSEETLTRNLDNFLKVKTWIY